MLPDYFKIKSASKELLLDEYKIVSIELASDINEKQSVELIRYQDAIYDEIKRRGIKMRK